MISEHSAHSTPLPFGIRTWLWRYTYLLLLIFMIYLHICTHWFYAYIYDIWAKYVSTFCRYQIVCWIKNILDFTQFMHIQWFDETIRVIANNLILVHNFHVVDPICQIRSKFHNIVSLSFSADMCRPFLTPRQEGRTNYINAAFISVRYYCSWWRHKIEIFSALLALCEGNPSVTDGFPSWRPVTRSFDFFFDLHLNKQLSKQSRSRCFWDTIALLIVSL